jgi:hypothetical protein
MINKKKLHTYSWMGFIYQRLISSPEWPTLNKEERAEGFLEILEGLDEGINKDRWQRMAGSREENLQKTKRIIGTFEIEESQIK